MAVDTRQKRMSMMGFGTSIPGAILFEADGSVDADDRAHLLGLYSGIALATPSAGVPIELRRLMLPLRLFRRKKVSAATYLIITRLASLEVMFPLTFTDTEDGIVLATQQDSNVDSLTTSEDDIVMRTEVP